MHYLPATRATAYGKRRSARGHCSFVWLRDGCKVALLPSIGAFERVFTTLETKCSRTIETYASIHVNIASLACVMVRTREAHPALVRLVNLSRDPYYTYLRDLCHIVLTECISRVRNDGSKYLQMFLVHIAPDDVTQQQRDTLLRNAFEAGPRASALIVQWWKPYLPNYLYRHVLLEAIHEKRFACVPDLLLMHGARVERDISRGLHAHPPNTDPSDANAAGVLQSYERACVLVDEACATKTGKHPAAAAVPPTRYPFDEHLAAEMYAAAVVAICGNVPAAAATTQSQCLKRRRGNDSECATPPAKRAHDVCRHRLYAKPVEARRLMRGVQ